METVDEYHSAALVGMINSHTVAIVGRTAAMVFYPPTRAISYCTRRQCGTTIFLVKYIAALLTYTTATIAVVCITLERSNYSLRHLLPNPRVKLYSVHGEKYDTECDITILHDCFGLRPNWASATQLESYMYRNPSVDNPKPYIHNTAIPPWKEQ